MSVINDRYMFQQGRIYAVETIAGLGSLLTENLFLDQCIKRLDLMCVSRPPAFASGVRSVLNMVRGAQHGQAN